MMVATCSFTSIVAPKKKRNVKTAIYADIANNNCSKLRYDNKHFNKALKVH